jgi:glycosyltransferase involved in cell wall biosynthesis
MKPKIAVVTPAYDSEVAEVSADHARQVVRLLSSHYLIEVFTTVEPGQNNSEAKAVEFIEGIPVNRHPLAKSGDRLLLRKMERIIAEDEHGRKDEERLLEEMGPYAPSLLQALAKREREFDLFLFFSFPQYLSYFGVLRHPEKSVFIPTSSATAPLRWFASKTLFNSPRAIIYDSIVERDLVQQFTGNSAIPHQVIGLGPEETDQLAAERARSQLGIQQNFCILCPGCSSEHAYLWLDSHRSLKEIVPLTVLLWNDHPNFPAVAGVLSMAALKPFEKISLLTLADFLVLIDVREPFSLPLRQAWAAGIPIVVHGDNEMLRFLCKESQGGLWFRNSDELAEVITLLSSDEALRVKLGRNGQSFFQTNYAQSLIESKYRQLLNSLLGLDPNACSREKGGSSEA